MPIMIKTDPITAEVGGIAIIDAKSSTDATISEDDSAYVWESETNRGRGLRFKGTIKSKKHMDHGITVRVVIDKSVQIALGKEVLRPLRDTNGKDPLTSLSHKLYKYSLNRIVDLDPDEVQLLDSYF